jgi:cytochrome c oxidase subunit 3
MSNYTDAPIEEKQDRAKKHMMWFAIVSLVMMFAGLTSAYVVSSSRRDWIEIELPQEFYWSTGIILLSSLCLFLAKKAIKSGNNRGATILTLTTFALGGTFVFMQFQGFESLVSQKIFLTGPGSNVNAAYIYLMVLAHLAHIVAGLIALTIMTIQTVRGKYTAKRYIGFEVGAIFWHFVDILWIYLLLFLLFAKDIF